MMLIVQKRELLDGGYKWFDAKKCDSVTEAEEYIRKRVCDDGQSADSYRIVNEIAKCRTRVEFIGEDISDPIITSEKNFRIKPGEVDDEDNKNSQSALIQEITKNSNSIDEILMKC